MKNYLLSIFTLFTAITSHANYDIFRSMDRPQLTEKPRTLGKGIFQLEGTALKYAYDKDGSYWARDVSLLSTTLKYGLSDEIDLFASLDTIRHFKSKNLASRTGLGDFRLGAEYTFWENKEFGSALSVAPFVKFPTNTDNIGNNVVEFGVKAPFTMDLENEFTFGAMLELDVIDDVVGSGYHFELVNSVSITRPIVDAAALFAEYYSRNSFEDLAPWIAQLGVGGVYAINSQLLIDGFLRLGITEAANDVELGVGAVYRF